MEIRRYAAMIWHWAWLIVLVTIITGSTAYVINKQSPEIYSASTSLIIDLAPGVSYSDLLIEERLTQTYIEVFRSRPIMENTRQRLAEQDLDMGQVNVSTIPGTQIIRVTAESTDPVAAAATANTISIVFIEDNEQRQQQRFADAIADKNVRLKDLEQTIVDIERQIAELEGTVDPNEIIRLSTLDRELREAQFSYEQTFELRDNLTIEQESSTDNVSVIEDAIPINTPVRPRVWVNTLMATVVGALAALGVVFLIEYLDDTIKTPEEIAEYAGVSTLGAIAYIKGDEPSARLVTFHTPRAPVSEAYRVLRTNINFAAIDGGLRTLLVSSASPGEGKSTTSANLGVALAQTGKRVIVVDADLRRPTQHKIFELPNNNGLTTALLDNDTPVAYHIQRTKISGLRLLTSGPMPPNPAELLNSQRMGQILTELQAECDVVLFDTPPMMTVADAAILAPQIGGVVLVVQLGKTKRDALLRAGERLQQGGAVLYGVVLNQQRAGRSGYYDYYYYSRYYSDAYPSKQPRTRRGLLGWLPRANRG